MAVALNPYLMFPGTAREAMAFYADVLGGELSLLSFADAGAEDHPDPQLIMHAHLGSPAGSFMASDGAPGQALTRGDDVAVSLSGDEAETMRGWFARLSEGGTVTVPLAKQMWGDEFGACTDRFGVRWMVNIGVPPT